MKKRNLKNLQLNKNSISDLTPNQIIGGRDGSQTWSICSRVMSCITYTQHNNTCVSCLSIQLCITRDIPCQQEQ
ncbi:hypothetical protein [uncultured Kordia sp.]|uniref:hypothetical protein n=1 Tax=uncultured Kordia sp. TaxID=507699 RepID=UPI002603873A|nr:hypothetical protein [uncultured Kordia sp.]